MRQKIISFLAGAGFAAYAIVALYGVYWLREELRDVRRDLAIIHSDMVNLTAEVRDTNNELAAFSMSVQQKLDEMTKEQAARRTW